MGSGPEPPPQQDFVRELFTIRKLDAFVKERVQHPSMPPGMEERLKSALRRAAPEKK